jgi:hypothetical protein
MTRLVACAASLVAVTALAIGSARAAPDSDAASAVVLDRTYVCGVELKGGLYQLEARAHAGVRSGATWAKLPYAALRTGNFGRAPFGNMLAWVTAGAPVRATTVDQEYWTFPVADAGTVGIYSKLCRQAARPVPLQPTGLRSRDAGRLGTELVCEAPPRVLVRVQAVLSSSGRLRSGQDFHFTHAPLREATLAVRTLSGKPLAFATVSQAGKASLFTARGCVAE